jgi:hypothetical protein
MASNKTAVSWAAGWLVLENSAWEKARQSTMQASYALVLQGKRSNIVPLAAVRQARPQRSNCVFKPHARSSHKCEI